MKKVELYTDGACSGNPGPGGFAAILFFEGNEKVISGGEKETTNNRMELMAVIEGLSSLNEPCEVELYTDSKYVQQAITLGWIEDWEKRGWKRKTGPLLNPGLWQRLNELLKKHRVTARWVEGHAGVELNERADKIAVLERDKAAGKQAVPEPKKEEEQLTRTEELEREIEELKERLKLLEDERERLLFKEETKFEERL
ncbi:MAG: ribonuclease HI [Candidatus Scatomorpha sp.]